jgi:ParB family chromosome partitioning protein
MTSGVFKAVPISSIWVDRENRQRKELDESAVASLATSMSTVGQINPIVIQRDGQLRAGENRLAAAKLLGWTDIMVQYVEDLDEAELQLLELDENIKRKSLTWQEECDAISKYHSLKRTADAEWTQVKTAEALGMTPREVGQKLAVKEEMANPESRVHNAVKFSEARNIVARTTARRNASTLDDILDRPKAKEAPLLNADFNEWAPAYSGPKFNFIHCDFPYGINADNQQQGGNISVLGGYEDSPDVYFRLLRTLSTAMENVVDESAHLIFWFSMRFYRETLDALSSMGWTVNKFPLIWHKSDNVGLLPDPKRGFRRTYETAFLASRGDRPVVEAVAGSWAGPSTKRIHMSEKPEPMLSHFFRMTVDEYSRVLDPTAGSANAIRVAASRGASSVLGLEKDPEFFQRARDTFYD